VVDERVRESEERETCIDEELVFLYRAFV
ncbi:unnamed protein product, partial [uncultured virus]